jgi:hypothetical protein
MYHEGELLAKYSSVDMAVFEYDNNLNHPSDLIRAYDGWDGYAIITEDEYKLLKDLSA